jgi:hypothetical protein
VDDEVEEVVDLRAERGFEASRRSAQGASLSQGAGLAAGLEALGGGGGLEAIFEGYIKMMEDLIDSPDFATLVTPDMLKQMFDKVPGGMGSSPEIVQLLDSPQFQDPKVLRQTMREGVRTMRTYSKQMLEVFSDPGKMGEVLDQLPAGSKEVLEAILGGDTSKLKVHVLNLIYKMSDLS